MILKCLIIEDEKLAQDILIKYISLLPDLILINCCNNASEAISFLHSNKPDLIFLDINMPELSGIEFLKTLINPPLVIITTAYSQYAVEGYEYAVCDYLLKPIRYERFLKAINKAIELNKSNNIESNLTIPVKDFFTVKEDNYLQKIYYADVLYIQASGNYVKFFLRTDKVILIRATLSEIEKQLPISIFIRVHKSFIVAVNLLNRSKNQIDINGTFIPIGTTFRNEVFKKVK
jgi:DNA-binding LytR/AlgR family response regulator